MNNIYLTVLDNLATFFYAKVPIKLLFFLLVSYLTNIL